MIPPDKLAEKARARNAPASYRAAYVKAKTIPEFIRLSEDLEHEDAPRARAPLV
jgi:hypothetical protein